MIKTLALTAALLMSGCSSITTSPNNDDVIPYEDDKSLAWNVMNQVESADKLRDVKVKNNNSIKETSALGHLGFAILSGNFLGGLTSSLATDSSGNEAHSNIIMSLDLSDAPGGDLKLEVINQLVAQLKIYDPSVKIGEVTNSYMMHRFKERSDTCMSILNSYLDAQKKRTIIDEWQLKRAQRHADSGECTTALEIDIIGPSNEMVFKHSEGHYTVRVRVMGARANSTYMHALSDSYLYRPKYPYANKWVPPFVQYKDNAFFFMKKTSDNKEQMVPLTEIPGYELILIGKKTES